MLLGLKRKWNMSNAFTFAGRHGVQTYTQEVERYSSAALWGIGTCGDHILECTFNFFYGSSEFPSTLRERVEWL